MAIIQLLLIIVSVHIGGVMAVEENGKGVCVITWSTVKTTRVSYIHTWYHTYWGYCGWERCQKKQLKSTINYKVQYEDQPRRFEYCCTGYKRETLVEPIVCEPVCRPSCINSNCTQPGFCSCWPGYLKQSSRECLPSCNPSCINGKCVGNNVCECLPGYEKNQTSSHECYPKCSKNCENGECVAPETCRCLPGYVNGIDATHCVPECFNCEHGTCDFPNVCHCFNGYTRSNATCMPECTRECENSVCDSPDHCTCDEGYVETPDEWNVCKPYCAKPCINGVCSDPDFCTCFENFRKTNKTHCEPICRMPCVNGECVAPDFCECKNGYQPLDESAELLSTSQSLPSATTTLDTTEVIITHTVTKGITTNSKCVPSCQPQCVNGKCVAPNKCECFEGYEKSDTSDDDNVCEPKCFNYGCLNGNCTAPNECTCADGYLKVNKDYCLAVCDDNCEDEFDEKCNQFNSECVQVGKHYLPKLSHYNSVNAESHLENLILTLDWDCNEIFNNESSSLNDDNTIANSSRYQSTFQLYCATQVNLDIKHIDFICGINANPTLHNMSVIENSQTNHNIELLLNEMGYNSTITLIYPKEASKFKKGKCELCLSESNMKYSFAGGEVIFTFISCPKQVRPHHTPEEMLKDTPMAINYVYIITGVAIVVGLILISLVVYRVGISRSSYRVRNESSDGQELKVEEEFLVCRNNAFEED